MRPGAVIADRFELLELVGIGGMGSVFRAHDRHTGAKNSQHRVFHFAATFHLHGMRSGFESPDGRWLVLRTMEGNNTRGDIFGLRAGDSVPIPLVATPFRERDPALSPDGRWLVYASDETGQFEVYVRPFPDVQAGKWQVSTGGGTGPRWSHRGNELFYRDAAGDMIAVQVAGQPTFGLVGRQRLFSANNSFSTLDQVLYDVAPDDRRFLMLHVGSGAGTGNSAGRLILVENFLTELRRAVP